MRAAITNLSNARSDLSALLNPQTPKGESALSISPMSAEISNLSNARSDHQSFQSAKRSLISPMSEAICGSSQPPTPKGESALSISPMSAEISNLSNARSDLQSLQSAQAISLSQSFRKLVAQIIVVNRFI